MSDIKNWSQSDAANTDSSKSGMPEGMPRSDVNNRVREHMGALRRFYEDSEWVALTDEHDASFTLSRVNDSTFRVTDVVSEGTNASAKFPAGTWVKLTIGGSDFFGSVTSLSYSAPNADIVLGEIINSSYATAVLPVGSVTLAATYNSRRIRSAAFSKTGTTSGQSPPQVPTIDSLESHVLKPEGAGGGIDADQLDGEEGSYYEERDLESHSNVLANGNFGTWLRGTTFDAVDSANASGKFSADHWVMEYDGSDSFDYSRAAAGDADDLPEFLYSLRMLANGTNVKGGISQVVPSATAREIVRASNAVASFYARVGSGDSISRLNCRVICSTTEEGTPAELVSATWGNEGTLPTLNAEWEYMGGAGGVLDVTSTWTRFTFTAGSIPSDAVNVAVLIWIDQVTTTYGVADELFLAGVQLEAGVDETPFQHPRPDLSLVYSSDLVSGEGVYIDVTSTTLADDHVQVANHGFGRPARLIQAYVLCTSDEYGYVVGDLVHVGLIGTADAATGDKGMGCWTNDTDIGLAIGANGVEIMKKDGSGDTEDVRDANWELHVQAWK